MRVIVFVVVVSAVIAVMRILMGGLAVMSVRVAFRVMGCRCARCRRCCGPACRIGRISGTSLFLAHGASSGLVYLVLADGCFRQVSLFSFFQKDRHIA